MMPTDALSPPRERGPGWDWEAFGAHCPESTRALVRLLADASSLLTRRDVYRAICDAAKRDPDLGRDSVIIAGRGRSSRLAAGMLTRALGDLTQGQAAKDPANKAGAGIRLVIAEDVAYSGGGIERVLSDIPSDRDVTVVVGFATKEAGARARRALRRFRSGALHIGKPLPLLFDGMKPREVLATDIFVETKGGRHLSLLFDILGLDDHHCMHLMPHKLSDAARVPLALLHGACRVPCDAVKWKRILNTREVERAAKATLPNLHRSSRNALITNTVTSLWDRIGVNSETIPHPREGVAFPSVLDFLTQTIGPPHNYTKRQTKWNT